MESNNRTRGIQDAFELYNLGQLKEAAFICKDILQNQSDNSDALHLLGLITHDTGDIEKALLLIEKAIDSSPQTPYYYNDFGVILHRQGQLEDAYEAFDQALALKRDYAEAYINRGIILQNLGRLDKALADYDEGLLIKPDYVEAHLNRGVVLQNKGRLDEALAAYSEAVRIRPDFMEAHSNRGVILQRQRQSEKALAAYDKALSLESNDPRLHVNRGACLEQLGLLKEALYAYDRALSLNPNMAETHNNRGNVFKSQGRFSEAISAFQQAIRVNPNYPQAESNYLFCLNYDPTQDDRALYEAHRAWGDRHRHQPNAYTEYSNLRDPEKTLRVGLVSSDLGRHPIGYLIEPLLKNADSTKIRFTCYSGRLKDDDLTEQLKFYFHEWRSTLTLSDTDLAETICADGIDILIDAAGHTAGNRLGCFVLKAAPIQVQWAGYCHSIPLLDYCLWDPIQVPEGEERWFVETVIRLPDTRWCYAPPEYAPQVADPPVLKRDYITFGSFNNLTKINQEVIALWACLLKEVPNSQLILNWPTLASPDECERFRTFFVDQDIAANRIELRQGEKNHAGILGEYGDIDIALDPFPFSGCTTTCEALWMGVPVITLPKTRPVSRQSQAFLTTLKRKEWVARNSDDYIRIAANLARNPDHLTLLRRSQRDRMAASPICDGPRFARHFEDALRKIWRIWCN